MGCRAKVFVALPLCIAIVGTVVYGYPNSVPNSPDVCSKMTPGHGPRPQNTPAPYKITLNKQHMHGGHNLQIVLEGKDGHKFKGFYMQVRDQDGSAIGSFLISDEHKIGAHNCFNQKHNAIHHKNRNDKENILVYWKAPESFDGKVRVMATVLQDFETYWVNVKAPEHTYFAEYIILETIMQWHYIHQVKCSFENTTHYFTSSSDFIEKRKAEPTKNSKATRILNYNPYSPFSPLLSAWDNNNSKLNLSFSSSENLLSQASEDSPAIAQERQLFGFPSFDFHGTPFSSKFPPTKKPKNVFFQSPEHSRPPYTEHDDHLPLFHPNKAVHHHHLHNSITDPPKGSLFYNKHAGGGDIRDKHAGIFSPPKEQLPFSYPPPLDSSYYNYHIPPTTHHETSAAAPIFPTESYYEKPAYPSPYLSQTIQNDKGNHYFINHHHAQSFQPNYPKKATYPDYGPTAAYRPKDILTRITSYLPNIYNALTNNPLFNLNVDNTFESIWKPLNGLPTKHNLPVGSSSTTSTTMQMPKYGYLVYNPVRNNPYFVIPAENEDEFVANHLGRRKDKFP